MMKIKDIIVINKYNEQGTNPYINKIVNHLQSLGCNVELIDSSKTYDYTIKKDLAVVIGGDGTMLGAARSWGVNGTPLVGINKGRVGFLTDISKDDVFSELTDIVHGNYQQEKREVLNVKLYTRQKLIAERVAINDFLVHCSIARKLIETTLFINDEFVYSQYCDGLIVATSTGSSAHALSAGGSIVHPSADVFNIVPISPQSLSNRPLLVSTDNTIKILLSDKEKMSYSIDGLDPIDIEPNSYFICEKNSSYFELYHPKDYSYYGGLRNKLNWN